MTNGKVVVLTGGIGGAKLALGMAQLVPPERLTVIVNTGDDFTHLGLRVCPDIDTLIYTLAGLSDPERGWGRRDETWGFSETLKQLGGESWFALGDRDLAVHVERTQRLETQTLSEITSDLARRLGCLTPVVPVSDQPIATMIRTDEGELPFQTYFVRRQCQPRLLSIRFEGAAQARVSPRAQAALVDPDLTAIILAPSNPYLSIDPILAVPGLRTALQQASAPVVAVTPIPGGHAVKGPTAKIMEELGVALTPAAMAEHYRGVTDGLLLDDLDRASAASIPIAHAFVDTLMRTMDHKVRVAGAALDLAARLRA